MQRLFISSILINSNSSKIADSSKLYRPLFLMNASTTGANKLPFIICLLKKKKETKLLEKREKIIYLGARTYYKIHLLVR